MMNWTIVVARKKVITNLEVLSDCTKSALIATVRAETGSCPALHLIRRFDLELMHVSFLLASDGNLTADHQESRRMSIHFSNSSTVESQKTSRSASRFVLCHSIVSDFLTEIPSHPICQYHVLLCVVRTHRVW